MGLILLALLLLSPNTTQADTAQASLAIAPETAGMVASPEGIRDAVQRLFDEEYGRLCQLSFHASSAESAASARISLSSAADTITVSTDLIVRGVTRSLVSTVPRGAAASLIATMTADLAYLCFLSGSFPAFPLSPAPALTAVLPTDSLQSLLGGNPEDVHPMGIAATDDGVAVGLAHGYVTLGPGFRIIPSTARDILGQSAGRERLQLSGIAAGSDDDVILLAESQGKVLRVNPRIGGRQAIDVPTLSGSVARLLDADTVVTISSGKIVLSSFAGLPASTLPTAASYISAFAVDAERNVWAWDAGERRIRVLTAEGREVFSIRPLIKASVMQLPQQLEVLDDGGFLLAGSGELWRFESTGIPVWRLTRIPGRPGEQLPASFSLAADRTGVSFTLMDGPSRRLLSFAAAPSADPLSTALSRLDTRRQADLQQAAGIARQNGLSLMAWQLGDQLARIGGPESERAAGRIEVLRDAAGRMAELADSLQADLLFARADAAYLKAGDLARELAAESPADEAAAALLSGIVSRRQDVRTIMSRGSDIRVVAAAAEERAAPGCAAAVVIQIHVRNAGTVPLTGIRVHAALPGISEAPDLASIESLGPGEEKLVTLSLSASATHALPANATLPMLFTYQKGVESFSTALTTSVAIAPLARASHRAVDLACRAVTNDVVIADLIAALPAQRDSARHPFAVLVQALDSLGRLRGAALGGAAAAAIGAATAAAATAAGAPPPSVAAVPARAALRGLSPDDSSWALLMSSVAGTLGLRAGFVTWPDAVCAVVETGVSLAAALEDVPGLQAHASALAELSRDGSLCIPFAGRAVGGTDAAGTAAGPEAAARGPAEQAFRDGVQLVERRGLEAAGVAWIDPQVVHTRIPRPFPIVLPLTGTLSSDDEMLGEIISHMEQDR